MKRYSVPKHSFLFRKKSKCNNKIVTKIDTKAKVMISHTEASFQTRRNDVYGCIKSLSSLHLYLVTVLWKKNIDNLLRGDIMKRHFENIDTVAITCLKEELYMLH